MSLTHPDFISTFKRSRGAKRHSIWLPYFAGATKTRGANYEFRYNGGTIVVSLKSLDVIMLYGATGTLDVGFLDDCATYNVVILIHRRGVAAPTLIFTEKSHTGEDVLTAQITTREHQIRATYLARTLVKARLDSSLTTMTTAFRAKLDKARSITAVRLLEAEATKRHWSRFYSELSVEASRRNDAHAVNKALDASSVFMLSVILRWVLFHRLSAAHGFLHEPTRYASLVYDLMEPYRYIGEQAVMRVYRAGMSEKALVASSIEELKAMLDEEVYLTATHQLVIRKTLLHGVVLALRAYLLGEMTRFVVPTEGPRRGGRKIVLSYTLPGRDAPRLRNERKSKNG
jgi:CRISPR/Cas system-associated endonuclease Cas1